MYTQLQQCIIEKASLLFYRYGIRSITMDFIASELGISKRTLYENFKNKEMLIIVCIKETEEKLKQRFSNIFASETNAIEKLLLYYGIIIEHLNKTSRSFLLDVEQFHSEVNEEYEKHREKSNLYIRNLLEGGVKDGLIRSDLDVDIVAVLHNNQIEWLKKSQQFFSSGHRYGYIIQTMIFIFLRGIVTEEGRAVLEKNIKEKFTNNTKQ